MIKPHRSSKIDKFAWVARPTSQDEVVAGGWNGMFYTYVLKSVKDEKLYVGWTDDLKARFRKHNKGLVTGTKNRTPFTLLYYEACTNK